MMSGLVAILSSAASAQLAASLLNWDGETSSIPTLPKTLVETGFNKNNPALFKPYAVNVPQWRSFMQSNRYVYLPAGRKVIAGDSLNYTFPVGTVLIRDVYLDLIQGDPASRVFIEVQFQIMKADKEWSRLVYVYKEDGSAVPVTENDFHQKIFTVELNDTNAGYGTSSVSVEYIRTAWDCSSCHYNSANGFITQQLNNGTQLASLVQAGVLAAAPNVAAWKAAGKVDRWYTWDHPGATPAQKFFSYLAGNCSHCHNKMEDREQPGGPTSSFEYFSDNPIDIFKPVTGAFFVGDSAGSFSFGITRMADKSMPPGEFSMTDATAIKNMVNFLKKGAAAGIHHLTNNQSIFDAALNNNILRLSRPGPVKLFDISGREIPLKKIDAGTFAVMESPMPGIYIAKMGSRICKVRNF
jgi:hypothetical protein